MHNIATLNKAKTKCIGVKQVGLNYQQSEFDVQIETFDTSLVGMSYTPSTGFSAVETIEQPLNYTKISRVKFKQRMTQTERIAVREAAKTDAIVFDFMDLLSEATYIDLTITETIDGVNYLESLGVIASGRANEILNTPITEDEAF